MKKKQLFLVRNSTFTYPVFYVEAKDILEATTKAKKIVDEINFEKVIAVVSTVDTLLLELNDE
jgi:hypothetical protein